MDGSSSSGFVGALDVDLDLPLASAPTRVLSALLDYVALVLLWAAATAAYVWAPKGLLDAGVLTVIYLVGAFALQWLFFVASELALGGRTPGKVLLRLRAVHDDGSRLGVMASLIRNLLRPADILIGVIVMFANGRSKRLGDLAAGTVVVREERPQADLGLRIPPGFRPRDVAVVEQWFTRAGALKPEKRDELAAALIVRLERDYPELFTSVPAELAPELRLERVFRAG